MNFKEWLDKQLSQNIPENVTAFNFNIYEQEIDSQYDVQLVGCIKYDTTNDDWACKPQYSTGEDLFQFNSDNWENALRALINMVNEYLLQCNELNRLRQAKYITAGFVDGDLEVIISS